MTLDKAFATAIDNEGIGIISEARLYNYLNDLQAYSSPAIKRIVSTMANEGYFSRLQPYLDSSEENYEIQFTDVESRLVKNEGFQTDLIKYVLDCLAYAVHKTGNAPISPMPETPAPKRHKKSASTRANLKIMEANGNYLIEFDGNSYELDQYQYKAIMRKKDMPADRLTLWLRSYADEKLN